VARGSLRIYLGASPGVGKTFRMLGEGVRRFERGTDVVIGVVETHGRLQTAEQIRGLETVPMRSVNYRDTVLHELDVDGIIARNPRVVLVDEYAHTNAPGSLNEKRWQDVEQLLKAGIDVISTLNIQHLESLNDVIFRITGAHQRETVPDSIVRRADQLELVDMAPEAIRRRMAHGNIYPAERIDPALANYFRLGNLGALRELALIWVADRVEDSLQGYLESHGIAETWETRERVVVGITGVPDGEALIRRAARMSGRIGGDLLGVHVVVDDGLTRDDKSSVANQRRLVTELGGTVYEVVGHDPAEALASFARREKATQLVIGATRRSRWHEISHGSFVARVTRLVDGIDVHVIATGGDPVTSARSRLRPPLAIDRRRLVVAWMLSIIGLPLLIAATVPFRASLALSTEMLLVLTFVITVAAIGGRLIAAVVAIAASLLVNWFYVPPYNTLTIAAGENATALVVFVLVAVTVGSLVNVVSQRSLEARRARLEAEALLLSATGLSGDPDPLPRLVGQLVSTFGLDGVQLLQPGRDSGAVLAAAGVVGAEPTASFQLAAANQNQPMSSALVLQVFGRALSPDDQRLLQVLADQIAMVVDNRRLADEASEVSALADVDAVRIAMLRAVSHDLRTPLASIKAMISGLRDPDVAWTSAQLAEALLTVDEETDRLNRLVGNLLDASRLQIGALAVDLRPTTVIETIMSALQSVNAPSDAVEVDTPPDLSAVMCDPVLLERSLANIISNAIKHSPTGGRVRIDAADVADAVHIRVVDRGVGIAAGERTKVIAPFQRLGDQRTDDGVGLGLSIAKGFVDAMNGSLRLDDTPGGGLTVTITLPRAEEFAG
jgi:two-component system sensor histidine kinase KdpD